MSEIKIEKDVPVPTGRWESRPWKATFAAMETGDSFYIEPNEGCKLTGLRSNVFVMARKHGVKIVTRAEGKGLRVWKVAE